MRRWTYFWLGTGVEGTWLGRYCEFRSAFKRITRPVVAVLRALYVCNMLLQALKRIYGEYVRADYLMSTLKLSESANVRQALCWATSSSNFSGKASQHALYGWSLVITREKYQSRTVANANRFECARGNREELLPYVQEYSRLREV